MILEHLSNFRSDYCHVNRLLESGRVISEENQNESLGGLEFFKVFLIHADEAFFSPKPVEDRMIVNVDDGNLAGRGIQF